MEGLDFVELLPKEIVEEIFSYLPAHDLSGVCFCSRTWRERANVDSLWFHHCLLRGWAKYGLSTNLKTEMSLSAPRPNLSGNSPVYHLHCDKNSLLPGLCKWQEIFARAHYLAENWQKGRYYVAPLCRGHKGKVTAIDSNGQVIVSGSDDCTLKIWNIHSSKCKSTLLDHTDAITAVKISEGNIVTACADGIVRIYDLQTRKLKYSLEGHAGSVDHLHFSGNVITTASSDKTVRVWTVDPPRIHHILRGHLEEIECLVVHQKLAVTGSWDTNLLFWDIERGKLIHTLKGHEEVVTCCAFDNKRIVSGSADGTLRLWATVTGRCRKVMRGHTGEVYCTALGYDVITSGSSDSTIIVWNKEGDLLHRMEEHLGVVRCMHLDGDKLVTGGDAKKIVVWNYLKGQRYNVVHRQPTSLHLMWVNDTKLITASPQQPGTITILSYW